MNNFSNEQDIHTPARQAVLANQVPPAQTVNGTLEHSGNYFDSEQISDIPPDFDWMCEMPLYRTSITWPPTPGAGTNFSLNQFVITNEAYGTTFPWLAWPMSLHRWFNGEMHLRFTAVKPSRTPGKAILYYQPSGAILSAAEYNSVKGRIVKKEWDFQQTTTFEFTVPGFNPSRMRPTGSNSATPPSGRDGAQLLMPSTTYDFGRISLRDCMPYQPGSVFPDSFTIFLEMSLKKPNFATPCDSHGKYEDFFQIQ